MTGPMTPGDPMSRSGARWCKKHNRWECASAKEHHATALRGLAYCRHCAGQSTAVAKARGEANLLAWSLLSDEHESVGALDPADVVLRSLRVAVMRADFYAARLQELAEAETAEGVEAGPDALVGPTYAAGRDGQKVETGEQRRALTRLEAEERDRAVRFAKTAHDMGIDTRRLELEQAQASVVVTAVGLGLDAIPDLTAVQRDRFLEAFLAGIGRPVQLDQADESAPVVVAGEVQA